MDEITTLNRATYDRIAGLYADNLDQLIVSGGRYFAALEDAFLSRLPRRGVVGDLGCGPGRDGARIAAAGHAVLGVDLSGSMLRLASTGLAGRVVQGDLRAVPLASASLDGIWNVASLLHVPEQGTGSVLREFRRLLRTEGVLALVTALGGEPDSRPCHTHRRSSAGSSTATVPCSSSRWRRPVLWSSTTRSSTATAGG